MTGNQNDRHVRSAIQAAHEVEAILVGQLEVKNDQVHGLVGQDARHAPTVGHGTDLEVLAFQIVPYHVAHGRIVIDHEYMPHRIIPEWGSARPTHKRARGSSDSAASPQSHTLKRAYEDIGCGEDHRQPPGYTLSTFMRREIAWLAPLAFTMAMIHALPGSADVEPITPVGPAATDPAKVDLGGKLFHDVRLSKGNTMACVSCHRLDSGGADDRSHSPGADGRPLDFNSPTIFNAALNYRLNWRGNFRTLEQQNEFVPLNR